MAASRVVARLSSLSPKLGFSSAATSASPLKSAAKSNASASAKRIFSNSRLLAELGCLGSMMPLHSAIASARLKSILSSESQSWGLIPQDVLEEESTSVGVGKGGVGVKTGQPGKGTTVGVGKGGVGVKNGKPGKGTTLGVGKGGVGVRTGNGGRTKVGVGKGGVNVGTPGKKGKPPVVVGVKPGANPFNYHYAATQDQLQDDRQTAVFFLEKDLSPNSEMNLVFTKSGKGATFLPRQVSHSLPFSSAQLPAILNQFSVSLESEEAEEMKQTVSDCEQPAVKGEEKYCATSLESMIDFTTSKLGKNIQAVLTEVDKETDQVQKYTILKGVKKIASGKTVVCHKEKYPYAVFFFHATSTTRAYVVPLLGADGTKAKATAVCHTDTSSWNPKHLAFQILKVKPGTVPVCHFLPEDHIVWTRN